MSVRCANCGRDYDVTLFEFGHAVICICGKTVTFRHEEQADGSTSAKEQDETAVCNKDRG